MAKYLKYFMWNYQETYQNNIQNSARGLFKELSPQLEPVVFLIGFRRKAQKRSPTMCIEPKNCGVNVNLFSNINELSEHIYSNDSRRDASDDPILHQRYENDLKTDCLRKAVEQLVDKNFDGRNKISFASHSEIMGIYEIFVVLQVNKDVYNSFYPLSRTKIKFGSFRPINVYRSLIDALGYTFLEEAIDVLCRPNLGTYYNVSNIEKEALLRTAASQFINTVISGATKSHTTFDLFNTCNYISSLKYEGASSIGKIIICKADNPNINTVFKLTEPVGLHNHRGVRKLLEIASNKLHLYSNGEQIIGLASLGRNYNPQNEDLFVVNFTGHNKWELIHSDQIIMNVKDTKPGFPRPKINKSEFDDLLKRMFQNIPNENLEKMWQMINKSTEQKHGALIIISNEAEKESERLKLQSTKIDPTVLDYDFVMSATSIDGAVLLDPSGVCHSIGVILDGISVSNGDSARGSRFNSAVRYVEMKERRCIAVIISEDGMVDLYPKLKPRIKKSEIGKRLNHLITAVGKKTVDYDEYEPLMSWFTVHEFYLSQDECNKINKLKTTFEEKWIQDRNLHYAYQDLRPDPEMNDTYFLNEV